MSVRGSSERNVAKAATRARGKRRVWNRCQSSCTRINRERTDVVGATIGCVKKFAPRESDTIHRKCAATGTASSGCKWRAGNFRQDSICVCREGGDRIYRELIVICVNNSDLGFQVYGRKNQSADDR